MDALYTFGNVPLRPANLSNARYVGSQPNLEIRWAISKHFLAALNLAGTRSDRLHLQFPQLWSAIKLVGRFKRPPSPSNIRDVIHQELASI